MRAPQPLLMLCMVLIAITFCGGMALPLVRECSALSSGAGERTAADTPVVVTPNVAGGTGGKTRSAQAFLPEPTAGPRPGTNALPEPLAGPNLFQNAPAPPRPGAADMENVPPLPQLVPMQEPERPVKPGADPKFFQSFPPKAQPLPQPLQKNPQDAPGGPKKAPWTAPVPTAQDPRPSKTLRCWAWRASRSKRGDYVEAVRRFTEYLQQSPQDAAVRRELAGILVRIGERQRAIEEYRRLLAARPDDLQALLGLADALIAAREYREAAALLTQALQRTPNDVALAVRLARVATFQRDFLRAHQLYEQIAPRLRPDTEPIPADLPALLLDLQRPADALKYLTKERERRPNDAAVLSDLVRAHAGMRDIVEALKVAEELRRMEDVDSADRLRLAEVLLSSSHVVVAGAIYGQILAAGTNVPAQIGLARVAIYQHQPEPALRLLEVIRPAEAEVRRLQIAWGEYYQLVGEYTEGLQIYQDMICRDPLDAEALLARAKLLQFMHEPEKAKAEYSKVPPDGSYARQGRLGWAATFYDQRRYGESIEFCEKLLAELPADGDAAGQLIRSWIKAGDCPRAVTIGRGFLAAYGRVEPAAVPVQLALGRALLESGKNAEAAREFECLLARPGGRSAEAWYGLARARGKVSGPANGDEALLAAFAEPGHETRNRLLLADLFSADQDDRATIELTMTVLKHDSKNLAGLIRLADAQLRDARPTAYIGEVVRTSKTILALSAGNVRGHLALARAFSTAADYRAAIREYDVLIAIAPNFLVPRREKARVLFSDHQYAACAAAYEAMLQPTPEQLVLTGLLSVLPRCPQTQAALSPLLAGGGDRALAKVVAREADALPDPAARACLRGLLLDADARAAEIAVIQLENDAKRNRDWRNFTAIPIYKELIGKEPDNIEAVYDLGQIFGQLKQTHAALGEFAQALNIDPLHREAAIASGRAGLELNPRLTTQIGYFNQGGRQGLASISKLSGGALFTCPWREEDETITLGYTRVNLNPPNYEPLDGNWLTLGGSLRLSDTGQIYALTTLEQYSSRITARPTFELGGRWEFCDGFRVTGSAFLNNVLENGESIQQDIFRTGVNLGFDATINRIWHATANCRLAYYSDNNRMTEFYAATDVVLRPPPCQLKVVFDMDYLAYSQQTSYVNNDPNFLFGAVHPYFAPAGFTYYEARIEWTQWLSRDFFVYSNQCWFSLQYALGFDNSLVPYDNVRGILNWDIRPWLSVGVQAEAKWASVYDMQQVYAYATVRFPCRLW